MGSDMQDTLWRDIESELKKSADSIDPDYIDRRINELCELEARRSGLRPPEAGETKVNAVITRITARVRRKMPVRRIHPLIRIAAVACIMLIVAFFAFNYMYARATERCFLIGMEITRCCGTDYCPCTVSVDI